MAFGRSSQQADNALQQRIRELEMQLAAKDEELKLQKRLLEAVNTSTHLGIWIATYNDEGVNDGITFTDEFRRMLGYSKAELPDEINAFAGLIDEEDRPAAFALFAAAAEDKTNRTKFDIDYRLVMKSGEHRMFHAAGECLRKPDGTPTVFIGTFSDIEDQIRTAEAYELTKRRQDAVEMMMLEGSWSMDLTKNAIDDINSPMVFSDQFKKILGYSNSYDFPDVMNSWITKMHPDDVAAASEAIGRQLSDPTGKTVFDMEYRMLHKDGNYRWVRASSMVVWSKDKTTPLMAAGTILDITEQKKNQIGRAHV